MVKIIFLHICLFITTLCFSQNKQRPSPPVNQKPIRTNYAAFSLEKRFAFYPFNKSYQIKVVSFGLQLDSNQRKHPDYYKLPTLNDTICISKLDDIQTLSLTQIDTLTDILYNECSRWNIRNYNEAGCYFPRNAILFYDKEGKVFEYMEICFECIRINISNSKMRKPDVCDYMYKDLEAFFKRIGVRTSAYELLQRAQ